MAFAVPVYRHILNSLPLRRLLMKKIPVSDIDTEENTQILDTNVQEKCVDFREGYVIMSLCHLFMYFIEIN